MMGFILGEETTEMVNVKHIDTKRHRKASLVVTFLEDNDVSEHLVLCWMFKVF